MGFVPVSNVIRCSVTVISVSRPVVPMLLCFVDIASILFRISLSSICPRSIVSRRSVGFVGSSGPFVFAGLLFVESFALVVMNGRLRTASSFVLTSSGTGSIASGFRFAQAIVIPFGSRCGFFEKFDKNFSNITSDRTPCITFAVRS